MSVRMFVKPAPNKSPLVEGAVLKVRKPSGQHLADAGEFVPRESYWLRRLADGDVVEAQPPTPSPQSAKDDGASAAKPR